MSAKDRFVNLADDTDAYCRAFEAYRQRSEKLKLTNAFFRDSLGEHLRYVRPSNPMKVAGVGSGSGQKDIILFQQLLKAYPNRDIIADIFEPSPELLEIFKSSLEKAGLEARLTVNFHVKTSQQFRAEMAPGATYDMIYALEVLYYEDSIPVAIKEYFERISIGGMLMLSITTSNSGWHKIAKSYSLDGAQSKAFIGSDDVRKALVALPKEMGARWDEIQLPNACEVTPVFAEGDMTQEAYGLAEFASHVANFPKIATEEEMRKFKTHLKSSEVSEEREGRIYMLMPFTMSLVRKEKE